MFFSPLAYAAESSADDTFAVKASQALTKNDFSDLDNGSATFSYSDNSKAYVKVSDLTVETTASDNSTSTVSLGKQYEVCSVSSDSRTVSCNYTTVRNDNSKEVKSLNIDNTAEHQIYSVPANAVYTDSDKKYFVTSFDNPYYKFRSIDADGHISGTNCIKLSDSRMVCSADSSIDMSKLSASDFAQIDNTEKYQINRDTLTNATLATSDGSCAIDGWVQADATHCCPPNDGTYSYSWDTAQQQCKVTKHNSVKENKSNILKDLLSAGAIFAGGINNKKDSKKQDSAGTDTTTHLSKDLTFQQSNIDKNAKVDIKFNPKIPTAYEKLSATINVKDTESDKLVVRVQMPSKEIETLTTKENKEFLLSKEATPGQYNIVIYVYDKDIRKATFKTSFKVYDEVTVLTDEQKKQFADIKLTQISEEIEQFSIAGDVSNVRYDEENSICSFDVNNGYAQMLNEEAFKVTESMPAEVKMSKETCEDIKASSKIYIENALLHSDGGRLGVVIDDSSVILTDKQDAIFNIEDEATINTYKDIVKNNIVQDDVSTIAVNDGNIVVSTSFDENNNALLTDVATNETYTLAEFADAFNINEDALIVETKTVDDTTITRVYVSDENTKNIYIKEAFNNIMQNLSSTNKKASRISDFTVNTLNTAKVKRTQKENKTQQKSSGRSFGSCVDDFTKEIQKEIEQQVKINVALLNQIFDT
jgi:hypothetical protein